jgi:Fe-S cluster assembly protein SufD
LADLTTLTAQVHSYITSAEGRLWDRDESERALEQARNAPMPSKLEEDWRKTDPEAFPWDRLEEVDAQRSKTDVTIQSLGGENSALEPLESARLEHCRDLQLISGDDYDAKFLYYHKALSRSPVCFRVLKNSGGGPVEITQRASGPGLATFTTIIVIEPGAEAVLCDRWLVGDEAVAAIGRTEIVVGEGAKLTYMQDDDAGEKAAFYRRARIQLQRDSQLLWCTATPGATWHAARLEMDLIGSGTEANFKGLFAGTGNACADHRTHQAHRAPSARSNLMMKTMLSGQAHSVYQGLITVPHQAQKTDAYQQCRNLLLAPGTHADAIPKLEIIADDVRCSHGASMGSVNKDQMFYLQSRGLTKQQAMVAISSGFAEEIIRFVPVPAVQERWRALVSRTIGKVAVV